VASSSVCHTCDKSGRAEIFDVKCVGLEWIGF